MKTVLAAFDDLYELIPYSILALLARIVAGLIFFRSGLTKVDLASFSVKPATFFLFDQEYKFRLFHYLGLSGSDYPFPATHLLAYSATVFELLMPLLVWAGFGTRLAATVLFAQTLVIETVYPEAYMDHALWAIALLMLMRFGPGLISLDHWLGRNHADA
jgi:putative oxidoreductase